METNTGLLLVATANGRFPIGHVLVSLQGRQPGAGLISHLLVLAGFRGQGVGSALMNEGHSVLHNAGLHVAEPMHRLVRRHVVQNYRGRVAVRDAVGDRHEVHRVTHELIGVPSLPEIVEAPDGKTKVGKFTVVNFAP